MRGCMLLVKMGCAGRVVETAPQRGVLSDGTPGASKTVGSLMELTGELDPDPPTHCPNGNLFEWGSLRDAL